METTIPFSGFYNSVHKANLDDAFKQLFTNDHDEVNEALFDDACVKANFHLAYIEYAKKYTEALADKLGLTTLKFKELSSPREYNFETNRILCDIDETEVVRIFTEVDKTKLGEKVRERFTSYDGFHSFYKNNLMQWPLNVKEWDINQVGTILDVLWDNCEYEEWELFDYTTEVAAHCVDQILTPEIWELVNQAYEWREKNYA